MKRLALAVICGFAIPFLYSVIFGPLSTYIRSDTLDQLVYVPIGWPKLILMRLVPLNAFPFRDGDSTFLLIYIISCNVILYGLLSYLLLLGFSLSRRGRVLRLRVPPPPNVQE